LAKNLCDGLINLKEVNRRSSRFFIKELLGTPIQAPSIIPQLSLSLCTISITTCNKLLEIMTTLNGDKIRQRLAVKAGNKSFSWLFDTGAAVTCMNNHLKWPSVKTELGKCQKLRAVLQPQETKYLNWVCLKWTYGSKEKNSHNQSM
jgi:hypothetical protein